MSRLRIPLLPDRLRIAGVVIVASVIGYYSVFAPPGSGAIEMGPFGLLPYSTWLHLMAYTGLGGSIGYALYGRSASIATQNVTTFLATWGYGIAIEVVQRPLPDRTFAVADMAVNALGATLAVGVWLLLHRYVDLHEV